MKSLGVLGIAASLFLAMAGVCVAGPITPVTITFDEEGVIPYVDEETPYTRDPGYNVEPLVFAGTRTGQLVFYGGDPDTLDDTFVVDWTSVSGNSLANGFVDLEGWPGESNSIIFLKATGLLITKISAAFQIDDVQDAQLVLCGYDSDGNLLDWTSVMQRLGDEPWSHTITLSHPVGFASVDFRGCFLTCSPFFIDNVEIEWKYIPPIPEPAGIVFLLPVIGGLAMRRRRRT